MLVNVNKLVFHFVSQKKISIEKSRKDTNKNEKKNGWNKENQKIPPKKWKKNEINMMKRHHQNGVWGKHVREQKLTNCDGASFTSFFVFVWWCETYALYKACRQAGQSVTKTCPDDFTHARSRRVNAWRCGKTAGTMCVVCDTAEQCGTVDVKNARTSLNLCVNKLRHCVSMCAMRPIFSRALRRQCVSYACTVSEQAANTVLRSAA